MYIGWSKGSARKISNCSFAVWSFRDPTNKCTKEGCRSFVFILHQYSLYPPSWEYGFSEDPPIARFPWKIFSGPLSGWNHERICQAEGRDSVILSSMNRWIYHFCEGGRAASGSSQSPCSQPGRSEHWWIWKQNWDTFHLCPCLSKILEKNKRRMSNLKPSFKTFDLPIIL